MTSGDPYVWKGYALAALIFLFNILASVLVHMNYKLAMIIGLRVRTAVMTAIYRKVTILVAMNWRFVNLLNDLII